MTTSSVDEEDNKSNDAADDNTSNHCLWIGIDLGTTHSGAAVWDAKQCRPKWMRLTTVAYPERFKAGRVAPTCVLLAQSRVNDSFVNVTDMLLPVEPNKTKTQGLTELYACVGAAALQFLEESRKVSAGGSSGSSFSEQQVSNALVTSLKRHILNSIFVDHDDDENKHSLSELRDSCLIQVTPLGCNEPIEFDATRLLAVMLSALRTESINYLSSRQARRKKLQPPSSPCQVCRVCKSSVTTPKEAATNAPLTPHCHAVIGVPAQCQSSHPYRFMLQQAATLADYASVSCLVESTAAAMAYGITLPSNDNTTKTIMVYDMGGGTTDVTIAKHGKNAPRDETHTKTTEGWRVKVIEGAALGGDDLDQLLLDFVVAKLQQLSYSAGTNSLSLSECQQRDLLRQCRCVKEELCGNVDQNANVAPPVSSHVVHQGQRVSISQNDLQTVMAPWLQQAESVVQKAVRRLGSSDMVNEVILVGGSSRVPAVRTMLKSIFPNVELCRSVNPMSAVAQGTAIQAAMESSLVPLHALKSAMMLDILPYAIGILTANETFVKILPRNATLPAKGSATFHLASAHQPGITFRVVEYVTDNDDEAAATNGQPATPPSSSYQPIKEFTFLLHRLSERQLEKLPNNVRSIEVGMIMRQSGELVCSLYDPLDPEHVAKRALAEKQGDASTLLSIQTQDTLGYITTDDGFAKDHLLLVLCFVVVLVLYVSAKVLFTEERVAEMMSQGQTTL